MCEDIHNFAAFKNADGVFWFRWVKKAGRDTGIKEKSQGFKKKEGEVRKFRKLGGGVYGALFHFCFS